MTDETPFDTERSGTQATIMQATFELLHEHGYAGVSISRIADRADISKSAIYHYYSGKDELLYDLLDHIITQLERDFSVAESDNPITALEIALVQGVKGTIPSKSAAPAFVENMAQSQENIGQAHDNFLEVRTRGIHDSVYRKKITELDQTIQTHFVNIIQEGIDQGVFNDVDADAVAQTLLTLTLGAMTRRVTANDHHSEDVYELVHDCIEMYLLADNTKFSDA